MGNVFVSSNKLAILNSDNLGYHNTMTWIRSHMIARTARVLATACGVGLGFSRVLLAEGAPLPVVPPGLPAASADGLIYLAGTDGVLRATTIDPALQQRLTSYLADSHSPIGGVVVADVHTGSILAMAQGRRPDAWGGRTHTALHAGFPAASLFKTVVATAAFEVVDLDANASVGLTGGCSHVRETGEWLRDHSPNDHSRMSMRTAFGKSCNGYFAKIGVNELGIGIITEFARRFGWETGVPADFKIEKSPFHPPVPQTASAHTVGSFAAGFGKVGLSAAHAAYIMLTIANRGAQVPLRLFRDSPLPPPVAERRRIFGEDTADRLASVLDASVKSGTSAFAFRRGKYRRIQDIVGGKTGTLTGSSPHGLTSWFAGLAPKDAPEVVIGSVVLLEANWHIKGPNLAAEGLWSYFDLRLNQKAMNTASFKPVATRENAKKTE